MKKRIFCIRTDVALLLMKMLLASFILLLSPILTQAQDIDIAQERLLQLFEEQNQLDKTINDELKEAIASQIDRSPKGEFETTNDFDRRMALADEREKNLQSQYQKLKIDRQLQIQNEIESLRKQLYTAPMKIELASYRPDARRFPFTAPDDKRHGNLPIPHDIAADFKSEISSLSPIGHYLLDENGEKQLIHVSVAFQGKDYAAPTYVKLIKAEKEKIVGESNRYLNTLAFSPDNQQLASAGEDKKIQVSNLSSVSQPEILEGHKNYISSISWHPSRNEMVSADDRRGDLIVWRIDDFSIIRKLEKTHEGGILTMEVSPNGALIATGGRDKIVRIWNYDDLSLKYELPGHRDNVKKLDFSPDSDRLVTGGEDGLIILWDALTGAKITEKNAHLIWINALSYSPDGLYIASSSDDAKTKIWNARDLSLHLELKDQKKSVYALDFVCPDGFILAAADDNQSISFWNVSDGKLFYRLENAHSSQIRTISCSSDGKFLASAGRDKEILLWKLEYDNFGLTASEELAFSAETGLPPQCNVSITFIEPSGNNVLDANEKGFLEINISNEGQGPAKKMQVTLKTEPATIQGLYYPAITEFGNLAPGESRSIKIPLEASYRVASQDIMMDVGVLEANRFNPDPSQLTFSTQKYSLNLTVAGFQTDDPNGDGVINAGEVVYVTTRIQNSGSSFARDVLAIVKIGDNVFFAGEQTREKLFPLDTIAPGAFKDITFQIYANREAADTLPVFVEIKEFYGSWGLIDYPLHLLFQRPNVNLQTLVIQRLDETESETADFSIDIEQNIPIGIPRNNAYALIIGNRNYSNQDIPKVEFAHRDAEFMKQYLMKSFGYSEGNILVYKDATQSQFKTAIQRLKNMVRPGSELFVYYVGHGAPDPEEKRGYFVPVDCDPNYVNVGGVGLDQFYEALNDLKTANTTVVIDACFSGSSDQGMLIKNISPVSIEVVNAYQLNSGLTEFTSSSGDEVSSWYPEKKHSLYTYFFLKGIQGAANANNDNQLTIGELRLYLEDKIPYEARRLNNRQQTPGVTSDRDDRVLITYQTE
jgi:WD40 repeat protein